MNNQPEPSIAQLDREICEFRLDNSSNKLNCFINSVLQAIFHIKPLKDCIITFSKKKLGNSVVQEHVIVDKIKVSLIEIDC